MKKKELRRQTAGWLGPPLRPRHPVRVGRVRRDPEPVWHRAKYEPAGKPVGQRQLRELFQDAEAARDLRYRVRRSG
jgi:hypothetical protein